MGQKKGDIDIGIRAAEEVRRIFPTVAEATRRMGVGRKIVYSWGQGGNVPGGFYLAKLHYAGADVIYILTGQRTMDGMIKVGNDEVMRNRKRIPES